MANLQEFNDYLVENNLTSKVTGLGVGKGDDNKPCIYIFVSSKLLEKKNNFPNKWKCYSVFVNYMGKIKPLNNLKDK
ncbi:MAG: hypothetical protein AABY32_02100 [Nanoarchaeota archaeon]